MKSVLVAAALIAQSTLTCGARHLTEADENSQSLLYVSDPAGFEAALSKGVRHVVVTDHLDLSSFSKILSTSSAGVAETTTTVTIQV